MTGLVVEPEDAETEILGKIVSDLQSNVVVGDTNITGSLHYVTDFTEFWPSRPDMCEGNFLALKFTHPEGSTTTVEIIGGTSGPVELDSDMNWVGRIANNEQKIKVVTTTSNGVVITNVYDLSLLDLEQKD